MNARLAAVEQQAGAAVASIGETAKAAQAAERVVRRGEKLLARALQTTTMAAKEVAEAVAVDAAEEYLERTQTGEHKTADISGPQQLALIRDAMERDKASQALAREATRKKFLHDVAKAVVAGILMIVVGYVAGHLHLVVH